MKSTLIWYHVICDIFLRKNTGYRTIVEYRHTSKFTNKRIHKNMYI